MNLFLTLISLLVLNHSFALSSEKNFCKKRKSFKTLKNEIQKKENRISFKNSGGLFNGGTCWWHSRFQRNSNYLAIFKDKEKKESDSYNKRAIRKIIKGKKIVIIPGFRNLKEFTKVYNEYIQKKLNAWQLREGVLKFSWIIGLSGTNKTTSNKLEQKMNDLYNYVETQENIAYTKIQIKGISAHAWLITDVIKTKNGFKIIYIDSNRPLATKSYDYLKGDQALFKWGEDVLIYLEQKKEQKRIKKILKSYCSSFNN